jgi:hypothetical protein
MYDHKPNETHKPIEAKICIIDFVDNPIKGA